MNKLEERKMIRINERQSRANEMYNSFRDDLLKRDLSNTENYDKAILTLSSTALAISLTAMKYVVPLETAKYIFFIQLGWGMLWITIFTSLVAFFISNKAISIQLTNAEDYYLKGMEEAFNRPNKFTEINKYLNPITGLIFIVAIFFIVAFVTLNITSYTQSMSKMVEIRK